MPNRFLHAIPVTELVDDCVSRARQIADRTSDPCVVISPYRFNPLGAHIDHQGGSVLARCLDQYTILCFWPSSDLASTLRFCPAPELGTWQQVKFTPAQLQGELSWDSMARASAAALADFEQLDRGIDAVVFGTLISGGLSSSASVILAYLSALADVNDIALGVTDLVELARRVENDFRGLNNGIQDQMSIAFGRRNHLAVLDVEKVTARFVPDPAAAADVCFLMCYSGISRDLGGSSFNQRVAECQQAARQLCTTANHLGQVPEELRSEPALARLSPLLQRRARHVYTEMQRVESGSLAWEQGDWRRFGEMMNASCQSSINDYESGSQWLISLHEIAREIPGVYGNRFSGGGYGGCLFMLINKTDAENVSNALLDTYLAQYPDCRGRARVAIAESESTVRIVRP